MLTIIILIALAIAFAGWQYHKESKVQYGEPEFAFFLGLIMAGIVAGIGIMAITFTSILFLQPDKTYTVPLASIQDTDELHGSFFLGSGRIDSEPAFWYYADDNGVYTLRSKPASKSKIIYTDDEPRLVYTCKDQEWSNLWLLKSGCDPEEYLFYVPRGSVTNDFTLDAQPE